MVEEGQRHQDGVPQRLFSAKRKRLRTAGYPEVEEVLLKWFKVARGKNVPNDGPYMMQKAGELALRLGTLCLNSDSIGCTVLFPRATYNYRAPRA